MKKTCFSYLYVLFCLIFFSCDPEEDQNTSDAPICQISCFSTAINAGDTLVLEDLSSGNPTSWEWSITPEYYSFVNGTSPFDQYPELVFTHSGSYQVKLKVSNDFGSDEDLNEDCIQVAKYQVDWTPLPEMPHARGMIQPVVFEDKIYLVGGTYEQGTPTDVFNPLTGEWESMNAPGCASERLGYRAFNYEDKIIVAGGISGPELKNYSGEPLRALGTIEEYVPDQNTWENYKTGVPFSKVFMNMGVNNEHIYLSGGCSVLPFESEKHSSEFRIYDPTEGKWTQHTDILEIQTYAATLFHKDKLYLLGGEYPNSSHIGTLSINIYDISADIWLENKSSFRLVQNCFGAGYCKLNDLFLIIGGQSLGGTMSTIQIVDPEEESTVLANNLPYSAMGIGACVYDQNIYVFGGASAIGNNLPYLRNSAFKGQLSIAPSIPK